MIINKKTVLLALSVIAIVGCGSKKESRSGGANKSATDIAAQETSPTVADPSVETAETNPDGSPLEPTFPKAGQSKEGSVDQAEDQKNVEPDFKRGSQSGIGSGGQASEQSKDSQSKQAESAKKKTVSFDQSEAIKTGGQTNDLFYTSSSDDGLMTEFRNYNKTVSADQAKKNASLAKIITSAKVNKSGSDMLIDITTDEQGVLKTYKLKATPNGNRHLVKVVSQTGDLEFQGGFLKCLDTNDSCENSYIKLKLSGSYTRIIFRTSYANRLFQYQESTAAGHSLWMTYINNSTKISSSNQKFKSAQIASYEVVNGRSAMGAMILTQDNESVGLSFPLVVKAQGTEVVATALKTQDVTKLYNLDSVGATSQKLSQAVTSVKLVNNNGLGDVRLKLEFGSSEGIWLVLSRVAQDKLTLEQIREFDKNVPFF